MKETKNDLCYLLGCVPHLGDCSGRSSMSFCVIPQNGTHPIYYYYRISASVMLSASQVSLEQQARFNGKEQPQVCHVRDDRCGYHSIRNRTNLYG
jgi:hypothetical protein